LAPREPPSRQPPAIRFVATRYAAFPDASPSPSAALFAALSFAVAAPPQIATDALFDASCGAAVDRCA
jgi:hypothetical protein